MVQSVLYVNPVTGKAIVAGSAVNPFKTLTEEERGRGDELSDNSRTLSRLSLRKAALKLLEIYEDRVNIPAYGDVLLSRLYRTVHR